MGANWVGKWEGGRVRMDSRGRRIYVIERSLGGKRHVITLGARTEREAIAQLVAFESEHGLSTAPMPLEVPRRKEIGPGVVYFLRCAAAVKIGFSTDVEKRIAALKSAAPEVTSLLGFVPGTLQLERRLHRHFAAYRMSGEWFRAAPEVMDFIGLALLECAA